MTKLLLLAESNTTGTGRLFACRTAALGMKPVLVTSDPGRYPFAREGQVTHVLADTSDQAATIATVRSLAGVSQVAGITSSSDHYIELAARCAEALGLPGPSADAIAACRNKGTQREILRSAGVAVPEFARAGSVESACRPGIGYPVIVKPVEGSGSVGVRFCSDAAQAAGQVRQLLAAKVNERGLPMPAEVLVEEFVTGREFSVEVFGRRPIAVVAKHLGPLPFCVETGHDVPPGLDRAQERLIADAAIEAVLALGLGWGAAHVELRLTSAGPVIIEVNPRLAGGMIPELVHRARGVDLVNAQVMTAAGLAPRLDAQASGSASIRFVTADQHGTVVAPQEAVVAALGVPGVVDAALYRTVGERVWPAKDFRGRIGHVIACSERRYGAAAVAEHGLELLASAIQHGTRAGRK